MRRLPHRRSIAIALATLLLGCAAEAPPTRGDAAGLAVAPLRPPDVRFEPSPHRVVRAMLELAGTGPGDLVYDLGSGDGRIPIAAARDFGARGVGIEIDPALVARARAAAAEAGVSDRVQFRNEDLFEADFGDASVVALFLYPDVNLRLRPRLLARLRPGTRIVSHWHDMGDWRPQRRIMVDRRPLYLWIVPER